MKLGLALSTGSARGLAHIGVLKVLDEEGIKLDAISGTSMGGLIAGMYASGMKPEEIESKFLELTKLKVFSVFRPAPRRSGFIDERRLERFVKGFVEDIDMRDLKIAFRSPSIDVETGERVVIDKGPLYQAITASMTYPILFAPMEYEGRYLLDGGFIDPLPVDIVRELGAEFVIASMPFPGGDERLARISERMLSDEAKRLGHITEGKIRVPNNNHRHKPPNLANIYMQASSILENEVLLLQLQKEKPDILIIPDVEDLRPLEFYRARDAIPRGEEATREAIPKLRAAIDSKR
jgi:NTE family protein